MRQAEFNRINLGNTANENQDKKERDKEELPEAIHDQKLKKPP
jgi:hypothetical protein